MFHWEEGTDGYGPGIFESGEELRNSDLIPIYAKNEKTYGEWSAPSQSLLQKWLREVHKVYLTATARFDATNHFVKFDYMILNISQSNENYDSYEDALEAGLYKALEYIETK